MTIEIKPGTLCFVASVPEIPERHQGAVVTAIRPHNPGCTSHTCLLHAFMFGELWDISLKGDPSPFIVAKIHLRPIAPPGLTEETVRDISSPTLAGVV